MHDFLKEMPEKPVIAALFGSYARGNQTKTSDIDLLLVFRQTPDPKSIESVARRVSVRTATALNPIYLGFTEFKDLFHNSTKEFFKNLRKDRLLLIGIEWWRLLEDEES
ncbi:MAG TPA: nucleotidyltransferase domain-containing protein [Candidatus Nanoarchaeia archaeon]|nr:nucleotidyltransferase domain-containing protein [Candidatus Nanoarchaeia archaeon]